MKISLVGMRYRVTPTAMHEMSAACPFQVELSREPDNLHDPNAIAVYCLGEPWPLMKLGYIPRLVAEAMAPRLDKGKTVVSEAWLMSVSSDMGTGELQLTVGKK